MLFQGNLESSLPIASLVLLVAGLLFFWTAAFFLIYHMIRFGVGTKPKQLSFVFLVGSIGLTINTLFLFFKFLVNFL